MAYTLRGKQRVLYAEDNLVNVILVREILAMHGGYELIVAENGRFYTLLGANLPGGRGMGEPVRLMVDLPNDTGITDMILFRAGREVARTSGAMSAADIARWARGQLG